MPRLTDDTDFPLDAALTGAEKVVFVEGTSIKKATLDDVSDAAARRLGVFNVLDYGAVGDGVTDDTAAIQAAMTAAAAARKAGGSAEGRAGSTNQSGGSPEVRFPQGFYLLSSSVNVPDYMRVVGEDAVIFATSSVVDMFVSVGYQAHFSGLRFRGGQRQIYIQTGNVDTIIISVDNCHFDGADVAGVASDSNSASTILSISNCRFITRTTPASGAAIDVQVDTCVIRDSWLSASSASPGPDYHIINSGSTMVIHGLLAAASPSATGAWVKQTGNARTIIRDSHFGGEDGGRCIIESNSGPNTGTSGSSRSVILDGVDGYVSDSKGAMVRLNDLPNLLSIRNVAGFSTGRLLELTPSIPTASLLQIGKKCRISLDPHASQMMRFADTASSTTLKAQLQNGVDGAVTSTQYAGTSSALLSIAPTDTGYGHAFSQSNTSGAVTSRWGADAIVREITATADNATYSKVHSTALSGFAAGRYTLCTEIEVVTGFIHGLVYGSDSARLVDLGPGRHIINIPFHYDSAMSSNQRVGWLFEKLNNGVVWRIFPLRVFSGAVTQATSRAEVYGSAAPTTGQWRAGDIVHNTVPAASGFMGWICVTTGSPGTWKTFGAISA